MHTGPDIRVDEATAARRRVPLFLVDATDDITPETGEGDEQPQISKNGGSFTNTAATLVHVGNGLYYVELTAGEVDTEGWIVVRYKSADTTERQVLCAITGRDAEIHACKAMLLNKLTHVVSTGVTRIFDDDGSTVLYTLTPSESGGTITRTPS